ncbi:Outer membrane protein (Porin) [Burkholderia multivorans]
MKKTLIAATLSSIGVTAHGQSGVTLYGLFDAGISYVNHSRNETGSTGRLFKYDDGVVQGSRWGIRGTEDLRRGWKALFILESGFNSGNGTLGQNHRAFGREAFVGLSNDRIGTLTFGRQYSFSTDYLGKYVTGKQTVAGNYARHINNVDQLASSRIDNSVKFNSASYEGFTFGVLYGFSNQPGAFGGSLAGMSSGNAGSSRTYSAGLRYEAGTVGIAAAYTDIRFPSSKASGYPSPLSIANVSFTGIQALRTYGFGGRSTIGATTAWASYTHTRFVPVTGTATTFDAYDCGAKHAITQSLTAGLGYTYMHLVDALKGHWNQVDASVDYILSKRTDIYLMGIYQIASGRNGMTLLQAQIGSNPSYFNTSGTGSNNQLAVRVGMRQQF